MRIANLLAVATIVVSAGLPAFAEPATTVNVSDNVAARCPMGAGGGYHGHGGNGCHKFGRLDLSDEQNEKLYQLKQQFADQIGTTRVEIKKERRKMRDLLTQPAIDRKAVELAQSKVNSLKTNLSNAKLSFKLDASEILTAEQRKQLRYGTGGSFGRGGGAKVSEADDDATLLSLLPESDLDGFEGN